MSHLKSKSTENFNAANLLSDKGMLAASIHCSYYSVFQLSKHILNWKCYISYDQQYKQSHSTGSHEYIISEIERYLDKKGEDDLYDSYDTKIYEMKRIRALADYGNVQITQEMASICIEYADELITELKKYYKVL